jgi:hypothetical protein
VKTPEEERGCYKRTFGGLDGQLVLTDLARLCNIGSALPSSFSAADLRQAEGMRAVFWYIYARAVLKSPKQDGEPKIDFRDDPLADLFGGREVDIDE